MKILLSAYACEPNKGSEPAVGWNWLRTLIHQGHEVHAITRSNNSTTVDAALAEEGLRANLVYYDLPAWCRRWKRWPGGMYFYYLLWQIGAYRCAKELHSVERFDCVHHITFASFRQPSFMGGLGIRFIFGPVGGGETTPRLLRRGLTAQRRLVESMRDFGNAMVKCDPMMHLTFSRASTIACTTEETKQRIPARYHAKCVVQPSIGILANVSQRDPLSSAPNAHFLFVGRLLYWKGLHLALRALGEVRRSLPDVRLKVIGEGSDSPWLKKIAEECDVTGSVDWIPWMPHEEIFREYHNNTAFVFPSLHDSGGLVVLEALAAGLPVVCLNLGGPGALVNSSCGIIIDAINADEKSVQNSLAKAMIALGQEPRVREALASQCLERARQLSWQHAAEGVYSFTVQNTVPRR